MRIHADEGLPVFLRVVDGEPGRQGHALIARGRPGRTAPAAGWAAWTGCVGLLPAFGACAPKIDDSQMTARTAIDRIVWCIAGVLRVR